MSKGAVDCPKKNLDTKKQYLLALQATQDNSDSSSTSALNTGNNTNHENDNNNDDTNGEMCLICTENIKIASLPPCDHKICHICSFRNVALYKKNQCLVCRSETSKLIYTENISFDKFDLFTESMLIPTFKNDYGIRFTSDFAKDETLKLLEYTCPINNCNMKGVQMKNFKELNSHVKEVHNKFYCELCAKFKKAFIIELKPYSRKQLHQHQSKGDSLGFKGHPECKFCSNKRFYSDDELFVHMRDSHEKCHICQQIDPNNPQYFRNYDHLSQHFKSAHYTCNVQSCLDQKFVVFKDEFDLQTHMAKDHAALYGNSIFSTNTFNNQLYTISGGNKKKPAIKKEPSSSDNYELKKKRLEERAKHYLNYSQPKFDEFLATNIQYSNEQISAPDLVEKYKQIFTDGTGVDYELLIYELSGLFPAKSNLRKDLEAINKPQLDKREMKEKFPSLPGTEKSFQQSFWDDVNRPKSNTKLKLSVSNNSTTKKKLYDLPALPVDDTPIFQPVSNRASIKTRGISPNTPVNGYSIPGYNPIPETKTKKTKNPWNSTKQVSNINNNSKSTPSLASALNKSSSSSSTSLSSSLSSSKSMTSSSYPSLSSAINSRPVIIKKESKIDTTLFPSLPNDPPPKKIIPRVNPINSSLGSWGSGITTPLEESSSSDAFNLDDIGNSLKTVKKGKRGKKVVYRLDI